MDIWGPFILLWDEHICWKKSNEEELESCTPQRQRMPLLKADRKVKLAWCNFPNSLINQSRQCDKPRKAV